MIKLKKLAQLNSTNLLPYNASLNLENIVTTAERLESFTLLQQNELVKILHKIFYFYVTSDSYRFTQRNFAINNEAYSVRSEERRVGKEC